MYKCATPVKQGFIQLPGYQIKKPCSITGLNNLTQFKFKVMQLLYLPVLLLR